MKKTKKTDIVKDLMKLGVKYDNAYRIAHKSEGIAAVTLVRLLEDLRNRGVLVIVE